jgi:hypothetical protein
MHWFHKHPHEPPQIKNHQLEQIIAQNDIIIQLLCILAREEAPSVLSDIRISFSKGISMATPGPITLVTAGQQVTASVVGFDQFGQPFTGIIPAPTFSSDDAAGAIVTFDPTTGLTTAVADGVANITATLTTAEGVSLTDTEAVTVAIPIVPPPEPVLSSIKVAFA